MYLYADVILPVPVEALFTYSVPEDLRGKDLAGYRVDVPLGKTKTYTGVVARCHNEKPPFGVRDIICVRGGFPVLLPVQYKLWTWIADYYLSPIGEVYKAALPAGLRSGDGCKPRTEVCVALEEKFLGAQAVKIAENILFRAPKQLQTFRCFLSLSRLDAILDGDDGGEPLEVTREELVIASRTNLTAVKALCARGLLREYKREVGRIENFSASGTEGPKPLTPAQKKAYSEILDQFRTKDTVLLHGVTSSGKTEIYIHLIQEALARGEQVLYLLPEIALTVQIMQRLGRVFGGELGIYHSRYSDAQRAELWEKQLSGSPCGVILGARSAVFLPFRRLGLIIIDEEHEGSFKQQEPTPRYHARSAALMLARMSGAKTLLGTATPSVESYYNAVSGKYGLVKLTERYEGMELPAVEIVDTKDLRRRKLMRGNFSPDLNAAMEEALKDGRQVILFQNRRGYSRLVECRTCGWVPRCANCDVSLTLHRVYNCLICHYCGHTFPVPTVCPACGEKNLSKIGSGTERVEDELSARFPEARAVRMDFDSTRATGAYDRILGDFASGKTDVLIGTQMVTKGLDFDRVAVVGIVDADTLLNRPDFRAWEYAFQMMTQVSGRSGRRGRRGRVFLQTRNPDLQVVRQIAECDYEGFYNNTIEERKYFNYPPFSRLFRIELRHGKDQTVESAAQEMASRLRQYFGTRVLGPDKPSVARIKNRNIRVIMLKIENGRSLANTRDILRGIRSEMMKDRGYAAVTVVFDADPM